MRVGGNRTTAIQLKSSQRLIQLVIAALCIPIRERARSTCTRTKQVPCTTRAHHVAVPLHHQHKAEIKGYTSEYKIKREL